MESKNNTDGEKPLITTCTICLIIIASFVLSICIQFPYHYKADVTLKDCFEFASTLFSIFSFTAIGCLGLNIAGIRKKGSKYYPKAYGKRKLDTVIKSILKNYQEEEKYKNVVKYVNSLSKEEYFEKVYILQSFDFEFVMLWNDFNFYQNSKNLKKQKYWFDLRKCIYIKLLQYDEQNC